jgi:hypothetical protein
MKTTRFFDAVVAAHRVQSSTRLAFSACWLAMCCLWLCAVAPERARAQLATSFYNVTGVETKVLPNAVRVTIRTDGTAYFGGSQETSSTSTTLTNPNPRLRCACAF